MIMCHQGGGAEKKDDKRDASHLSKNQERERESAPFLMKGGLFIQMIRVRKEREEGK
jgi:hypothetical protein